MKRALVTLACLLAACSPQEKTFEPVQGVLTKVERSSVTLKGDDGKTYVFDNADTEISLDHLLEHKKKKLKVVVRYEPNGDRFIARSIVDASLTTG